MNIKPRLFKLQGHTFDLQDLTRQFPTGSRAVICQEGDYYLSLEMPDDGLDDEQAQDIAKDEIATINGLASVFIESYQHVRISGVSKVDPAIGKIITTNYYYKGETKVRLRVEAQVVVLNPDGTPVAPTASMDAPGPRILELADAQDALERALFLYGKLEHNWRGLYMVLDAIREGT
jgi:hypothetical protein